MPQSQLPLAHCLGCIEQSLMDVFSGKVREFGDDLVCRHAVREHRDHGRHRDAEVPDARQPAHDVGIRVDPYAISRC